MSCPPVLAISGKEVRTIHIQLLRRPIRRHQTQYTAFHDDAVDVGGRSGHGTRGAPWKTRRMLRFRHRGACDNVCHC
jgi:hypothetical protein